MDCRRARNVARKYQAGLGANPGVASRPLVANWVLQAVAGGVHVSSSSNTVARAFPPASAASASRTSPRPCPMNAELDPSAGAWSGEFSVRVVAELGPPHGLAGQVLVPVGDDGCQLGLHAVVFGAERRRGRSGAEAVVVDVDDVGREVAAAVRRRPGARGVEELGDGSNPRRAAAVGATDRPPHDPSIAERVGVLDADGGAEAHLIAVVVRARHRGEDVSREARDAVLFVEVLVVLDRPKSARARLAGLQLRLRVGDLWSCPSARRSWAIVSPWAMYEAAASGATARGRVVRCCPPRAPGPARPGAR